MRYCARVTDALREWLEHAPVFLVGVVASAAASFGTGFGALPVLGIQRISLRMQDLLMSSAAGIMLAATAFSLVLPGLEEGTRLLGSELRGTAAVGGSLLVGASVLLLIHRYLPHEHLVKGRDTHADPHGLRRAWLFVIAITLHNFPEGLSVGVGFGGGNVANGLALTTAIFIQNLPEGFVVALALLGQGYGRWHAVGVACVTGFVETIGGIVGAAAVSVADVVLPFGLGFAGGAMLFVVSHEIIPETHRGGYEVQATYGLLLGFVVMLLLGAAFG